MKGEIAMHIILFTVFLIMTGLSFLLIKFLSKRILKKSHHIQRCERLALKLNGDLKYLLSVIIFLFVTLGVNQTFTYYLFNGSYFLLILLTLGFIFIIYLSPYALVFIPDFKGIKGLVTFKIVLWCMAISMAMTYGLLLLIDRSTKIYTDEGGVTFKYGSALLKDLGGIAYLLTALIGIAIIIIRIVANASSENENQQPEQEK